ncbi:MAG TPA: hypothetical protein VK745_08865 [Polyangiaceae bacterium]|jgi:hypothetical protein|nr:hypothetical protein [Polyangiaceae bacterium]
MATLPSFTAAALTWQNFYLLVGTAAATLVGLMFVAVTFGSSLVTEESSPTARAFLDPTFTHFVQILLTACLVTIPSMGPRLLGSLLLLIGALRMASTVRVYQQMKRVHQRQNDLELSDWFSGVVFPVVCYVLLGLSGVAFLENYAVAFDGLALVTLGVLLIGLLGAWELLVWMAIARSRTK